MNLSKLSNASFCFMAGLLALSLGAVAAGAEPQAQPEVHPLDPVIRWAEDALKRAEQIKDYTAFLVKRERINRRLQEIIDQQTDPWGIKVSLVEVKHVDLREVMQRAMAKQAESERERRAKVIHAEGESQAAGKLREAAQTIEGHPMAMQMRFLQTLADVGSENNTTIVFPVPIDLFTAFTQGTTKNGQPRPREPHDVRI